MGLVIKVERLSLSVCILESIILDLEIWYIKTSPERDC